MDHSFQTPEKLKSKERGDKRKTVSGEDIAASPPLSYVTVAGSGEKDDTLVLYLANDFHWRGATFVNVSGAGLAILKFKCKEKEVQLSRCVFVNATEFENRVLPYGYRVEMLMMRLCRWSSRRNLRNRARQWFERAQCSAKSLSPREKKLSGRSATSWWSSRQKGACELESVNLAGWKERCLSMVMEKVKKLN